MRDTYVKFMMDPTAPDCAHEDGRFGLTFLAKAGVGKVTPWVKEDLDCPVVQDIHKAIAWSIKNQCKPIAVPTASLTDDLRMLLGLD